ncbi:hypothetical protein BDN71DRAFT_1502295 [Pleurotus eryngii]|uniref:Uncharacterized protein n=1 Tax=Pleurotus eryngii TaxID=5323 RepID=A0A9P6A9I1_PLEER|nr:hypothetical protein BDN71DRAFT_1502295 [Pleurotus eryngii]
MGSNEHSKSIMHCFACLFHFATGCQSCKHKPPSGTSVGNHANFSKDAPPQNTGEPPTQGKPPPHNTPPSPSEPSDPTQPSTSVPQPSNVPSSNSPSSRSSPSSSPVGGAFGTFKAPISTGTSTTGSTSLTRSPSTQTSASANTAPSSVKASEHLATILGVVCGVLSCLLLCLAFWFFLRQRSRRRQRRDSAYNWQWFRRYDKWKKDVYSPSVKGGDLPDYGRVESGERRRSPEMWGRSNRRLTEDNLEILERHSSRTSSIKSHNTAGSGKSSNSQHTLPKSSERRDLKRVFSMGALTHTTGTTSKSALVIALPPESHPKETQGFSPSSKILQLLRTYDPVQSRTGPRPPGQIHNKF